MHCGLNHTPEEKVLSGKNKIKLQLSSCQKFINYTENNGQLNTLLGLLGYNTAMKLGQGWFAIVISFFSEDCISGQHHPTQRTVLKGSG